MPKPLLDDLVAPELRVQAAWITEGLVGPLAETLAPLVADRLRARPPVERIAYSVEECADAMGVGRDKVNALIRSGDLPSVLLTGRRLVRVEALHHFLAQAEHATAEAIVAEQQHLLTADMTDHTASAIKRAGGKDRAAS